MRGRERPGPFPPDEEQPMFKYIVAWLLGVPAGLLILVYVFTHLF